MGASVSSHRVDSVKNRSHWPLLSEYASQSIKSLDECAAIFLGDDDRGSEEDAVPSNRLVRVGSAISPPVASPTRRSSYPRFLTFDEFEEVFGMLVADADPHFDFFFDANSRPSSSREEMVCAHQVFCCLALLVRADLHAKVQFLLRLYVMDTHGTLPTDRKRLLLDDFLTALALVLSLNETAQHETSSRLEKTLFSIDDKSGTTSREFYTFCFTSALVAGYLHDIQSAIQELTTFLEKHDSHRHQQHHPLHSDMNPVAGASGSGRLKLLNRGATMLQLTSESLFWSMRARDLPWFWRQEHVKLHQETTVSEGLRVMKLSTHATSLLVIGDTSTDYLGFLVMEDFSQFLCCLLPEDAASTTTPLGDYMRMQVAKASQIFINSTIGAVLAHASATTTAKLRPSDQQASLPHYQCISIDECFFNSVLRLACGAAAVAVLKRTAPPPPSLDVDTQPRSPSSNDMEILTHDPLLGRVAVFDVLEWLLGDISLLNGREKHAVSSFPSFYFSALSITIPKRSSTSASKRPYLLDALALMHSHKTTGVLVNAAEEALYTLSADCLRDVFAAKEDDGDAAAEDELTLFSVAPGFDALTPLHVLLEKLPQAFGQCCMVSGEHSIAHVIHTMVTQRARRVYIQEKGDPATTVRGVVRATDLLRLLLQEQHTKPRFA